MSEATFVKTDFRVYTDEEIMDYDLATDMIGNLIAVYSKKIYDARLGKDTDDDFVKSLLAEQGRLVDAKLDLRPEDRDAVKKSIEHYGKILRNHREKHRCLR